MDSDNFKDLDALVKEVCVSRQLWELLTMWDNIKNESKSDKQKLQAANRELQELREHFEKIDKDAHKLSEPPLQYAVYLGTSPGAESDAIVGLGSARLEVRVKEDLMPQLQDLKLGQIVLLNDKQNIVAIRSEHISGETAEVVNIIAPEGEAKVLRVIEGDPPQLEVVWSENEELTITYSQALTQCDIRPGDFVQIDQEGKAAFPRAKPRLHVKAAGSEGTVVEITDNLYEQSVKIGDIVRIEPGLKFAFEKLPAYETGELTLEEVPDVTYDDIGGLDDQIEQIYDAIELPYLYRDKFERYQLTRPKGILLYGPPGCGKTMVAKAVANSLTQNIRNHLRYLKQLILLYQEFQQDTGNANLTDQVNALLPPLEEKTTDSPQERFARLLRQYDIQVERLDNKLDEITTLLMKKDGVRSFFLNVKGPELLDKYVGETEHRIRKIFEVARSHATYYTPVIIFFDEMEAMFRTRGTGRSSDIETTIVPQFLSEIDGVEKTSNLIIIGASNRQDMIDPAILRPKRLDVKVKVDRPTREAAPDIFAMYLLPTLPLSSEGITVSPAADGFGKVLFRTAYPTYYPPDESLPQAKPGKDSSNKDEGLLPVGCDFRLGLSLCPEDLDELEKLPSKSTVGDVRIQEDEENLSSKKLRRFKKSLEIEMLVKCLRTLRERYALDAEFHETVERFARQEWLAEVLILRAVDLLYGSSSVISVLTSKGNNYGLPLKEFISGATIANIVDRAKRKALKRLLVEKDSALDGISVQDLQQAIEQEFTENKEQFAMHKLHTEWGKMDEDIQSVQIFLETGESDPWSEEKLPLYNKI